MLGTKISLATVLGAVALLNGQEPSELVETEILDDGSIETREYVLGKNGEHIWNGDYSRTFADGKTLAVEGRYDEGIRAGKWRTYYESGEKESEGSYRDDVKARSWKLYFDRKRKPMRGKGNYENGQRTGNWAYTLESGGVDVEESGIYSGVSEEYSKGRSFRSGELRFHPERKVWQRHGEWLFKWPNGEIMLEAEFAHDQPIGDWRFFHSDGTYDPEFLPEHPVGEHPVAKDSPEEERALLTPELSVIEAFLPEHRSDLAMLVVRAIANRIEFDQATYDEMIEHSSELAGQVLRQLVELDLEMPDEQKRGEELLGVLRSLVRERTFDAPADLTGVVTRVKAITVHRWFSMWWLTRDNMLHWKLRLQLKFEGEPDRALFHPSLPALQPEKSRRVSRSDELKAALDWLASHQSPNGSWDCVQFSDRCFEPSPYRKKLSASDRRKHPEYCSGRGYEEHNVGVTGLALLAFFRAGYSSTSDEYGAVLDRAVVWLGIQANRSGLIGNPKVTEFVYDHGIATLALAEAILAGYESRVLDDIVGNAVNWIHKARNPTGAWRYDYPPIGTSDTSVTGWMLAALHAARRAGVGIDPTDIRAGLDFIASMTDDASNRVGYTAKGTGSARIPGINEDYRVERGEALTAIAMLSVLLVDGNPTKNPNLEGYGELLLRTLPHWSADDSRGDMYYWRAATEAFRSAGEHSGLWRKRASKWNSQMLSVARKSQVLNGDAAGSWLPGGPWAYAGGRVYSTAMMALILIDIEAG